MNCAFWIEIFDTIHGINELYRSEISLLSSACLLLGVVSGKKLSCHYMSFNPVKFTMHTQKKTMSYLVEYPTC